MGLQLPKVESTEEVVKEKIKKVKKAKEILPMELAWKNIFQMKNSKADLEKLETVKKYMEEGKLGRETYEKTFTKAEALRLYKSIQDIERQNRLDELEANCPDNYIMITQENFSLIDRVNALALGESRIGYDTETTGVDVYEDRIVGFCIYFPIADESYYIPIRHIDKETGERIPEQLSEELVLERIGLVLESVHVKIAHHAGFDIHMSKNDGLPISGVWHDTMIRMHMLNENEPSFKLKDLATKWLKKPSDKYDELFGKGGFEGTPLKYARYYGCNDPKITVELFDFQEMCFERDASTKKIKENYLGMEQPLITVINDMERLGFIINRENSEKQRVSLEAEIRILEKELRDVFGQEINFSSPDQLKKALYRDLNMHRHLGTKKWSSYSTDKKTLKKLSIYEPIIKTLLTWRKKYKLWKDFIVKLPELQKEVTGRWHSNFFQRGTVTGRFSSKNFNAQQIEPNARQMFEAPEGMLILGADFSGQENRILGHICQDRVMIDGWNRGIDFYSLVGSMTFNVPYEECLDGSVWRSIAKVIVLAVTYGISPIELGIMIINSTDDPKAQGLNEKAYKKYATSVGNKAIKDFLRRFSAIEPWMKRTQQKALRDGYVETLFGNKRRLPLPKVVKWNEVETPFDALPDWKRDSVIGSIHRRAVNAVIQGGAAEQTKLVMIEFDKWCKHKRAQGREFYLLCPVHDELLFYVPEDITQAEHDMIEKIMTQTVTLVNVEVKTDIAIGKNWKDMIPFKTSAKGSGFIESPEEYVKLWNERNWNK
ncbi:DNA polymerase [Bacillus thuringiensis]|uniref:DNA polymerase I n=1 Tax=Bacillus thuringiensis HD-771 TaxID=1218175 RepID=A0A9W3J998_BACTU|nr:DNA polymerase [Bacillus thuringiensis]AFQ14634.1 DNA polymerase I-3'-5' exonuclease and polymerase domain protein [Bacillus thuringiensis HD-771]MEC3268945.1 DNA polymerase [Bacillus thuringiensis]MEC3515437.1 DNA polymerase [Bacillus thuringiensis]MED2072294.1 DNA polymerase [Bacillus thuringiensis]MED2223629.1 DNA polymerase [Bacillus thuringiensis]